MFKLSNVTTFDWLFLSYPMFHMLSVLSSKTGDIKWTFYLVFYLYLLCLLPILPKLLCYRLKTSELGPLGDCDFVENLFSHHFHNPKTLSITTFRIIALSKLTFSLMTLSIKTFSIWTLGIKTFGIMDLFATLSTKTLSIMGLFATLSITVLSAECYYTDCRVCYRYAECHYPDCRDAHFHQIQAVKLRIIIQ